MCLAHPVREDLGLGIGIFEAQVRNSRDAGPTRLRTRRSAPCVICLRRQRSAQMALRYSRDLALLHVFGPDSEV